MPVEEGAALDTLDRVLRAGFSDVYFLRTKPTLSSLHDNPQLGMLL